jgi:hypothetical protein
MTQLARVCVRNDRFGDPGIQKAEKIAHLTPNYYLRYALVEILKPPVRL